MKENKLSKGNLWAFALGTVGRDMAAAGLFLNYLITYVMLTKQLSVQEFFVISIVFVVARIIDAILDPIMGNILDATHTRFGKFKPWIVIGVLGTAVIVVISFTNTLQGWPYIVAFGILYLLFNIFFTMNDIAYWGMLPALSSNADDRNALTSLTSLMAGIGAFLTNTLVQYFTVGDHALGGSTVSGYAWIAIIFTGLMLFTQGLTVFGVHEDPAVIAQQENTPRVKVSFRAIMAVLKKNDQVLWNALLLFIYMIVTTLSTTVFNFYLIFSLGYSGSWNIIFILLGQAAGVVVFTTFSSLSKRFSRMTLIRAATIMAVIGYALLLAVGLLVPDNWGAGKAWLLSAANILPSVGNGIYYLILIINIANAVEYNEYLTGQRNEGIIFSVRPFVTKLGMAAGQFLAIVIYAGVGIFAATQHISTLERDAQRGTLSAVAKKSAVEQVIHNVPLNRTELLLGLITLIPLIGIVLAYWVYRHKLTIDETSYANIVATLKKRRGEAK
ncbi:MFS transporter [Lacticaseibacillus saniviri]|uniref:Uncharacterized protein n=1 Tax=Lacticaseibacillus saniviri JCM 17471 = DSM 24301 TaxID=1293598 RepID=A0A0R2MQQ3_9LACO|nr:glycoside-pentoside-hexuronide (GPH):cation symporter [Lacticaseibacillus saniviri]KRO15942.1 hypothetical protein IV56_GL002133 [Lacticaseibacillus saniviri JCM 17471 = DSM 24301]MCG4282597.1 glycoside-pentoside-hexuronide (GPH):cation symporter [Lacticaseibacillus saniviri]